MTTLLKWGTAPAILLALGGLHLSAQEGPEYAPQQLPLIEEVPAVEEAPLVGPTQPDEFAEEPRFADDEAVPHEAPRAFPDVPPAAPRAEVPRARIEVTPTPRAAGSTNVIRNSGNGFGNSIRIDNGMTGGPSRTIISGFPNGYGNSITVRNNGESVTVTGVGGAQFAGDWRDYVPLGKPRMAWTERRWNQALDCWIYWGPGEADWHFYDYDRGEYTPWYLHPRYAP